MSDLFGQRKPDPYDTIKAEVQCEHCKGTRWVPFALRYAGMRTPPADIEASPHARCLTCRSGTDYTRYTGRILTQE